MLPTLEEGTIVEGEPLARHTSWRIGGPARYYATVQQLGDLQTLLGWAAAEGIPLFVLGGGTNLLVRDGGFPGLVVRYAARSWRIEPTNTDEALLFVDAGAPLAGTARRVCAQGYAGLAWAEGVPGTIGGAVIGNAGCYGGEIAAILEHATLLVAGAVERWPCVQMAYGYRHSVLKARSREEAQAPLIVLAAAFRLHKDDPATLATQIAAIAAQRKAKTPVGSSCGSVFKNPPGESAGRLIEQAGLKGFRSGGALISERHANYIVNSGGASSADVLNLIAHARREVERQFGIQLELEVQVVGEG